MSGELSGKEAASRGVLTSLVFRGRVSYRGKRLFFAVATAGFLADLASKSAAFSAVATHGVASPLHGGDKAIVVIPEVFYLARVWNPGGIWGIAQTGLASKLLVLFRALAVPGLVLLAGLTPAPQRLVLLAFGLFCAGALGNLWDNVFYSQQGVRDFMDFFLIGRGGYHYPTFNVADASIVSAALLLVLDMLFARKESPAA